MVRPLRHFTIALPLALSLLGARPLVAGFTGTDVFIAGVARASGQNDSEFYSTVWLTNVTASAVTAQLSFYETNKSNTAPTVVSVPLAPGETRRLDDVVGVTFGQSGKSGSIRVVSNGEVLASSRTYTLPASGKLDESNGLFFGAVPASLAIGLSETTDLQGVSQNTTENFRYNVGAVETDGKAITVKLDALAATGTVVGTLLADVPPFGRVQYTAADIAPSISSANARIRATVVGGAGKVIVFGTQIANVSNDSAGFEMSFRSSLLAGASGVTSLNGLTGGLAIAAGANVSVLAVGNTITIAGTGAPVATGTTNQTLRWGGSSWIGSSALTNDGTNVALTGALTVGTTIGLPANVNITAGGARLLSTAPGFATSTFLGKNSGNPAGEKGCCHVAFGEGALQSHTTNNSNVAVGNSSLNKSTTGSQNVAVGTTALQTSTVGFYNTALGDGTLALLTTGSQNTAVGALALAKLAVGENLDNVAVGIAAGTLLETGSSNVYIAHPGQKTESGVTRIGNAAQSKTFISGIRGVTTGSTGAIPVVIDSNGQLGTVSSSIRFKEDVRGMADASDAVMQLRPVTFRYKAHAADQDAKEFGLIAEEVHEVMPALVVRSADGEIETVKYHELPVLLLNELQKAVRRIEDLEREVRTLRDAR